MNEGNAEVVPGAPAVGVQRPCSADGGPLWVCVKMTYERRGLWYRVLADGTVQVRAGREGDDDIAIIQGDEATELVKCLSRVARVSKRTQPFAKFSELVKSREWHRARAGKPNDLAHGTAGGEQQPKTH